MLSNSIWPLNWHFETLSFLTPALRAFYVNEAKQWLSTTEISGIDYPDFMKSQLAYTLDSYWADAIMLFLWGVGLRVICFLVMQLKDKNKKL